MKAIGKPNTFDPMLSNYMRKRILLQSVINANAKLITPYVT